MQVWISGTGRAVPAQRLTTGEIEQKLGLVAGTLLASCGVDARFVCGSETQIALAATACKAALADAGLPVDRIDTLICGAAVPYQPIPATAPLIVRELAMADGAAAAFDVNSTCLSFLTGFEVAARRIDGGDSRHALVVSAEMASRALPWTTDPETAALFGDGAGAAVLSRKEDADGAARVAAVLMRSYPSGYEACGIGAGGTRFDFAAEAEDFAANAVFAMDGRTLFRLASLHFQGFVDDLLDRAGWQRHAVDLVIPHQASPAALAHMVRQTGFDAGQVMNIVGDYGNQIAASIPFALDMARRSGRVKAGSKLLLLGTSAGVSFGGIALVA
jgi:3-oxoacyl-[acyl-carrier-protein] synthase III